MNIVGTMSLLLLLHSGNAKLVYNCKNLVPRVLKLFGQRLVAGRDSGELEFYFRRISAVKQWQPINKLNFFRILQSLSWRSTTGQRVGGLCERDCNSDQQRLSKDCKVSKSLYILRVAHDREREHPIQHLL